MPEMIYGKSDRKSGVEPRYFLECTDKSTLSTQTWLPLPAIYPLKTSCTGVGWTSTSALQLLYLLSIGCESQKLITQTGEIKT